MLGMALCASHALLTPAMGQEPGALFSASERAALVSFWNAPGRLVVAPPAGDRWQVRLTPEGSEWLLAWQRAQGAGKIPPTQTAAPTEGPAAEWDRWVAARVEFDRACAQRVADCANGRAAPASLPPHPGPIPQGLLAAVGNPPAFARAVAPLQHTICFDTGEQFAFLDHVAVRPRYAYYRFPQGVMHAGTPLRSLPERELESLFAEAGMGASEMRVFRAVSGHEGGFESINTYDTGYVSVGFIQFACLGGGGGSLGRLLLHHKLRRPGDFARDFRRYGVEVSAAAVIVVVDPASGAELAGPGAARAIIEDKRLAAVFRRAGAASRGFAASQIEAARALYWPGEDGFRVQVGEREIAGKVSDVVRSEAGLATLLDRKVNRGSIEPFAEVLARVMSAHGIATLEDARRCEREIIAALRYREDYLANPGLSQPP